MNICWKKSDAECLMVNMLLFDNCCWIKVRSLDRPFGFLASPAHFLFLSLYQERYLERNKRKQVLSLHNLHNRCRYQIAFRSQQKINIFPPRGTRACAPVPPESMDQILGAPPTFTAFLKGAPSRVPSSPAGNQTQISHSFATSWSDDDLIRDGDA